MEKHKQILISVDEFETRIAILENRRLVEYYSEEVDRRRITGNIYLSRIKDIVPGMEASFVDIGLQRNAFLYVDEVLEPDIETTAPRPKIQQLLKPGQDMMVQILRDPVDTKGARVTAQVSLPGRKIVLMPFGGMVGVSKRLEEEERNRLHLIAEEIKPKDMGVIVRTAALGAQESELRTDLEYLMRQWEAIKEKSEHTRAPALINAETDLVGRVVRDVFSSEYDHIVVDSADKKAEIDELLCHMVPGLSDRVKLHDDVIPLFEKHDIDAQLKTALKRKVWLRSGGYIAIDKTEALTGIDVNTAKYTGGRDLEHTIYKTNLEAAVEIVHQIRLRDIGGIIVIDFIDMREEHHKTKVVEVLTEELEHDRTKSRVTEISRLGLVEMTRKNISEGLEAGLSEHCPVCGSGRILSRRQVAREAYRKMRYIASKHKKQAFVFKVTPDTADLLEQQDWVSLLRNSTGKQIFIKPTPGIERGEAVVAREGKVSEIEDFLDNLGPRD